MGKTKTQMTNQCLTINFFDGVISVLSNSTSRNYTMVVLEKIRKNLTRNYPFFQYVNFNFKDGSVKVSDKLNNVQNKKIGKLFTRIIDLLGPSLLRVMIMEELDSRTVKYLEKMGVKFFNNI